GTNCHIVLEQPPTPTAPDHRSTGDEAPRHHVVLASAKTARSLNGAQTRWQQFLRDSEPTALPDVAFTSQIGRGEFEHRAAAVGRDAAEYATAFADGSGWVSGRARPDATVAFVYGGGTQWPGMGRHLYTHDNVFHDVMHHCAQLAQEQLGLDLCELLYGPTWDSPETTALLEQTRIQQPALFAVQTAMTEQWRAWGVQPTAMVGHSLGEIVAATTAGVWSLPDAMRLVCWRGELMQQQEPGATLGEFERRLRSLKFQTPQIPIVSTVTGDWLAPEQAMDPAYWAGQVRSVVRFSDAVQRLLVDRPEALLLEVGPGATAQTLIGELETGTDRVAVSSMGNSRTHTDDSRTTREALAHLWVNGITIDWAALHQGRTPRRTAIPTYTFDTKRYWIDAPGSPTTSPR
ncbi:acyltransferase domain-containing protein, partial [Kitasatospora cystarginea]|uniref:acyltransferase domain-containing protein n=1 Tax=Kitasatospora cystarginea TaxID=58350 RepID=UPI0031DCB6C8